MNRLPGPSPKDGPPGLSPTKPPACCWPSPRRATARPTTATRSAAPCATPPAATATGGGARRPGPVPLCGPPVGPVRPGGPVLCGGGQPPETPAPLRGWFSDRRFIFVGDAAAGTHEVARLDAALPAAKRSGRVSWLGQVPVTFSDTLMAVRRWLWSEGGSDRPMAPRLSKNSPSRSGRSSSPPWHRPRKRHQSSLARLMPFLESYTAVARTENTRSRVGQRGWRSRGRPPPGPKPPRPIPNAAPRCEHRRPSPPSAPARLAAGNEWSSHATTTLSVLTKLSRAQGRQPKRATPCRMAQGKRISAASTISVRPSR